MFAFANVLIAQSPTYRVSAPYTYKNLSIFPVRGPDRAGSDAYITLDEGTKAGTVVITERSRVDQPLRRISDAPD